jgi:hypothetical protein
MVLLAYLVMSYVWAMFRLYIASSQGKTITNLDGIMFLFSPLTTPVGVTIMLASEVMDLEAPLVDPAGEQE